MVTCQDYWDDHTRHSQRLPAFLPTQISELVSHSMYRQNRKKMKRKTHPKSEKLIWFIFYLDEVDFSLHLVKLNGLIYQRIFSFSTCLGFLHLSHPSKCVIAVRLAVSPIHAMIICTWLVTGTDTCPTKSLSTGLRDTWQTSLSSTLADTTTHAQATTRRTTSSSWWRGAGTS